MKIAIIGNGISGISAAIGIRQRSEHDICLISSESNNFFSRTALMYVFMGHMRWQDTEPFPETFWREKRINRIFNHVINIDFQNKTIHFADESHQNYDCLILATGSSYNMFGWQGQHLEGVRGLYHKQDLEYLENRSHAIRRAVIIGGGLIGIELAEMLLSRQIPVSFLVREASFWDIVLPAEESAMISRHILEHGIDLQLNTQLKEIKGDENGVVYGVETQDGKFISCEYVGLTAGVHPNVRFLRETDLGIDRGILVDEYLRTNIRDVYAIGDCAELSAPPPGRRSIEPLWYTGKMMGEAVAETICGTPRKYDPGIWFNSAKFLDIEYQVYGDVPNQPRPGLESLYWEHDSGRKSIRINYDLATGQVLGFNLMGIRYRHQVCEKWIREKDHIETVLTQLSLANFDPEFSPQHEKELISLYGQRTGKTPVSTVSRSWDQAFRKLST